MGAGDDRVLLPVLAGLVRGARGSDGNTVLAAVEEPRAAADGPDVIVDGEERNAGGAVSPNKSRTMHGLERNNKICTYRE